MTPWLHTNATNENFGVSKKLDLAYLKLQLSQNVEEKNSYKYADQSLHIIKQICRTCNC